MQLTSSSIICCAGDSGESGPVSPEFLEPPSIARTTPSHVSSNGNGNGTSSNGSLASTIAHANIQVKDSSSASGSGAAWTSSRDSKAINHAVFGSMDSAGIGLESWDTRAVVISLMMKTRLKRWVSAARRIIRALLSAGANAAPNTASAVANPISTLKLHPLPPRVQELVALARGHHPLIAVGVILALTLMFAFAARVLSAPSTVIPQVIDVAAAGEALLAAGAAKPVDYVRLDALNLIGGGEESALFRTMAGWREIALERMGWLYQVRAAYWISAVRLGHACGFLPCICCRELPCMPCIQHSGPPGTGSLHLLIWVTSNPIKFGCLPT